MNPSLYEIRQAAREGRIRWRRHALIRASQRGITRAQALYVIHHGQIVEQQPRAKPFPKYLLMAMVGWKRPLYVAFGYDKRRKFVYVITVHWFDPRKWKDPWTRRRGIN